MIQQRTVHCFTELKNESIDKIKDICVNDFMIKIYKLVKQSKEKGTFNYDKFDRLGRNITYNNKNIEYQETFCDILDICKLEIDNIYKDVCVCLEKEAEENKEIANWLKSNYEYLLNLYNEEKDCSETIVKTTTNLNGLFGVGEFPFMVITIARIGNNKYYFYQIVR